MGRSVELTIGFCGLVFSILVSIESIGMGIGTAEKPGSGFLPFWSAVVLGILSIITIVKGMLMKKGGEKLIDRWKGRKLGKVTMVIVSFFVYLPFLPILGYIIATFGLLVILFGMMEKTKIWVRVTSALFTTLISYFVFASWLGILLPKGIFYF